MDDKEISELLGVTETVGDAKGEIGDSSKEGRNLFLGRSGVRKVDSEHGGGQD